MAFNGFFNQNASFEIRKKKILLIKNMNIMRGKTIGGFKKLVVGLFNLFISIENTTMRIFEIFLLHFISFFRKQKKGLHFNTNSIHGSGCQDRIQALKKKPGSGSII